MTKLKEPPEDCDGCYIYNSKRCKKCPCKKDCEKECEREMETEAAIEETERRQVEVVHPIECGSHKTGQPCEFDPKMYICGRKTCIGECVYPIMTPYARLKSRQRKK